MPSATISRNWPSVCVVELGDRHVERVVAGAVAFGLRLPELIAFQRIVEPRRAAHFDEGRGAADQRRDAGGLVRVLGEGRHERQIDVDVRIDEAGENQLARGIDHFGVRAALPDSRPMRVMVSSST